MFLIVLVCQYDAFAVIVLSDEPWARVGLPKASSSPPPPPPVIFIADRLVAALLFLVLW